MDKTNELEEMTEQNVTKPAGSDMTVDREIPDPGEDDLDDLDGIAPYSKAPTMSRRLN